MIGTPSNLEAFGRDAWVIIPAEDLTFAETSSPQESASESESELEEFELLFEPDFEPSESFFELNFVESRF